MRIPTPEYRNGIVIGLVAGGLAGAGLATWLAWRLTAGSSQRGTDTSPRQPAPPLAQSHQIIIRDGTIGGLPLNERGPIDDVADRMAHGDHHVERYATAGKGDPVAGGLGVTVD
jgi:hypothetical protein